MKNNTEISKFLSFVLRHKPEEIGIVLDSEGWVDTCSLLQQANLHGHLLNEQILLAVVQASDKKRFTLSADGKRIRAAQGHSIQSVDLQYTPQSPPAILYHGTAQRFLEKILEEGLLPQERQHVHLSESQDTALAVGKRYGKPALLQVNSADMQAQGHIFYCADNGVWLTGTVPSIFLRMLALD